MTHIFDQMADDMKLAKGALLNIAEFLESKGKELFDENEQSAAFQGYNVAVEILRHQAAGVAKGGDNILRAKLLANTAISVINAALDKASETTLNAPCRNGEKCPHTERVISCEECRSEAILALKRLPEAMHETP